MAIDTETYLKIRATKKLQDLTHGKEKPIYKSRAFQLCGHGLTEAQFDDVVQGLVNDDDPWLVIRKGPGGGDLLLYNDIWGDNVRIFDAKHRP